MFWKKKPSPNPLGVPLNEIALLLSTGTIKTSIEGNVLLARHEHYTTRVEVVPADPGSASDAPIKAVVRVITELPAAIQQMVAGRETGLFAAFNAMAALGAMTMQNGKACITSRLTIFEDEVAWADLHLPLLAFTIIGGTAAILGAMNRTFSGAASRGGSSSWMESDLDLLAEALSEDLACSAGGLGFTAEFGLADGAISAAAGHRNTALFQLRADQPHPEFGGGLFVLLQLPHGLPSVQKVHEVCMRLNELELAAGGLAPHFGAWCPGRRGNNVAYVSFLPNALYKAKNIALNTVFWGNRRALWGNAQLAALGYRA
jgi:hypothetical protein